MTSQPDYYAALRVKPDASQQEISRAYRALMRSHHPDIDGRPAGECDVDDGELLRIMQAYAVLGDPARRAAYGRSRNRKSAPDGTTNVIPIRDVSNRYVPAGNIIRITPVRWESGPWA